MPSQTLNLTITAGPDTQGCGGSAWGAFTADELTATGGTSRGPRSTDTSAWLAWLKRQIVIDMGRSWRFDWANATVTEDGWSPGTGHAPNGIRVKVTATKR